jgi:hypothetical protein
MLLNWAVGQTLVPDMLFVTASRPGEWEWAE